MVSSVGCFNRRSGFALPTVVISSLMLMMVLIVAVSATMTIRTGLYAQYYNKLAQEAAESGIEVAESCLLESDYSVTWSTASPLRPSSNCEGTSSCTSSSCYIINNSRLRTTFIIGNPTGNGGRNLGISSLGRVELLNAEGKTWQTYEKTLGYHSSYSAMPQISGGAGWKDTGHIGFFLSEDKQLYGYGENGVAQILDSNVPSQIVFPSKLSLPVGVSSVKKVLSSGQGASFMCIIGNNDRVYCKGSGLNLERLTGWHELALPSNMKVSDIVVNGYGDDNICVIAYPATNSANRQAYCAGSNTWSLIGNGSSNGVYVPLSAPTRFSLPSGLTAMKIYSQNINTCVIASDKNAYCSGRSDFGQIAGVTSGAQSIPVKYNIPPMGSLARYPKDILMQYHGFETVIHVLATDGTIWSSGDSSQGEFGDGSTTTVTRGGAASWFSQLGDRIHSRQDTNKCIDVQNGSSTDGAWIQVWSCTSPLQMQGWFFTDGNNAILNPTTGKCIDLNEGKTSEGTWLISTTCNGRSTQRWSYDDNTGQLKSLANTSMCVDIKDNWLMIKACSTTLTSQKFKPDWHAFSWKAIISGTTSFCGIRDPYPSTTASNMWCAGNNDYGQLVNVGTIINGDNASYSGAECQSTSGVWNANIKKPYQVDYSKLSTEWQYQYKSLQVIATDGQVYGAGANDYGKLGSGTKSSKQCQTVKFKLPAGVSAVDMSTRDEYTTYVLGDDGSVYAAGRNNRGQLGVGTTSDLSLPQRVKIPRTSQRY